jgi:hypothetical protein
MGGHNNQPKVGINGGRGIEEERRPGRNMFGGCCLFAWNGKLMKKINDNRNMAWPKMAANE